MIYVSAPGWTYEALLNPTYIVVKDCPHSSEQFMVKDLHVPWEPFPQITLSGCPECLGGLLIVSGEVTGEEYAFKKFNFIMSISRFYGW